MKAILIAAPLLFQSLLFQSVDAQNEHPLIDQEYSKNSIETVILAPSCYYIYNELDFEQNVYNVEAEAIREAYVNLLAKVEKLKYEKKLYQKVLHEYIIIPSEKKFTCQNTSNTSSPCQEAFIEPLVPIYRNENAVITYFVPDKYKSALLCVYDLNGNQLTEYKIAVFGYGQETVHAGTFEHGSYSYCLVVDDIKIDCMKMIIMK